VTDRLRKVSIDGEELRQWSYENTAPGVWPCLRSLWEQVASLIDLFGHHRICLLVSVVKLRDIVPG